MEVVDPVCGMKIDSEKAAAEEIWRGQTFYFCSRGCRDKFHARPEQYAKSPGAPAGRR